MFPVFCVKCINSKWRWIKRSFLLYSFREPGFASEVFHTLCSVGMYNLLISSIFGPALSDRKSDEKRDAVINVVREKKRVFFRILVSFSTILTKSWIVRLNLISSKKRLVAGSPASWSKSIVGYKIGIFCRKSSFCTQFYRDQFGADACNTNGCDVSLVTSDKTTIKA